MRGRFSISNGIEKDSATKTARIRMVVADHVKAAWKKLERSKEAGAHLADGDQLLEELVVERGIEVFQIA
jgi:hypothetical protein